MNKNIATKEFIGSKINYLAIAFPRHEYDFWKLLTERLFYYKCTEQEVIKGVYLTIDSVNKDSISIADVIQPILEARTINIVD